MRGDGISDRDDQASRWRSRVDATEREVANGIDEILRGIESIALVLDTRGRIVAHNQAWLDETAGVVADPSTVGVGADYLSAWTELRLAHGGAGSRAAAGVRSVLSGEQHHFSMDYETRARDRRRWFTLRASQLAGPASGALVTHVDVTHLHDVEHAIRGRVHRLWEVVEPGADFVLLLEPGGRVLGRTQDRSRSVQWPVRGDDALAFIHPSDVALVEQRVREAAEVAGRRREATFRARQPGDTEGWRHFHGVGVNMLDDPEVHGIVVAITDLTERLRSAAARTLSVGLLDQLPIAALATDEVGIVMGLNAGASNLLGVAPEAVLGQPLGDFVESVVPEPLAEAREATTRGRSWSGELEIRRADGGVLPIWMRVERIVDRETGMVGLSFLAIDHSEQRRLKDTIVHREHYDPLTGLANRHSFLRGVRELTAGLSEHEIGLVALVDVDRFRDVNATHGPLVGDGVLRAVGDALRRVAGPSGTTARLYGDLFAVAVDSQRARPGFGEELIQALAAVEPLDGLQLRVSASVGVRPLTRRDREPEVVIDEALSAVDEVKAAGGNGVRRFDDELRQVLDERLVLGRDLPRALDDGELTVEYQPLVRLDDGMVVGAEALVRWDHPTMGRIEPDRFIPIAEHSGFIHEIGAFVLDDACRNASRWRQARPEVPLTVAVNMSAAQLTDIALPERVRAAIDRYHLDPATIELELTESMIMDDTDVGLRRIGMLKATGARLAVDDFGTGYSSLARLKFVPLDAMKIDRSFVERVATNPDDNTVVRTIVELASALGVDVIAEGVETMDQGRVLREAGCTIGQGFLWSPSVTPEHFDDLLRTTFPCAPTPETGAETVDRFEAFTDALRTIQHELATPLAVLNTTVSMRDSAGGIPRELHGTVQRSVQRVSRLVESLDLLDRLDRGTLNLRVAEADLTLIVRRVAEEISAQAARPVDVVGPDRLLVEIDGSLVEQVVTNLLTNAMKYSPHTERVSVVVASEARSARVEVHDRGAGIPPDRVGAIWRKFGRLDHAVPGSGIGLYLARGIARAHGGDLRYRVGEPVGSVFVLDLPDGRSSQT